MMNKETIHHRETQVCLLRNPDGSPRWIWPAELRQPLFLAFYYPGSRRAQLLATALRLIFAMGLQRFIFRPRKMAVPDFIQSGEWAMFTGTAGPGRKTIIVERQADGQVVFHKIPTGEDATQALEREQKALISLKKSASNAFLLPAPLRLYEGVFSQAALPARKKVTTFTRNHAEAVLALHNAGSRTLTASEWLTDQPDSTDPRLRGLQLKCQWLQEQLDPAQLCVFGPAHGDFTPWNMARAGSQLYLYDWEMFEPLFPKGFDAFHYLFQQAVLVEKLNWTQLKKRLPILLETGVFDNETELQIYLRWYLMVNTRRYMKLYARQQQWHEQVYWLLQMWHDAMDDLLQHQVPHSALFAAGFTDMMGPYNYAALKCDAHSDLLEWGPNQDLDLAMSRQTARQVTKWMEAHALVQKYLLHRQSHLTALSLRFRDGELRHFDLLHSIRRKALIFMDVKAVVERAFVNASGLRCAAPQDSAEYVALFYALNHAAVPERQQHWKSVLFRSGISLRNTRLMQAYSDTAGRQEFINDLARRHENLGARAWWLRLQYAFDVCASFFRWDGRVVTVSGVDGAGKSTILQDVQHQIEKNMRREVVLLRHRPSLLPILSAWKYGQQAAEQRAAQGLPRRGKNQSLPASLLRFAYYYADYLLGQWYVFFKYVARGKVVLYDRYYFDFMADPRRSNLVLPAWLTRTAFAGLLRPDFNFFLYATPAEIRRRKQELSEADIEWLTRQYLDVFERLQNQDARAVYLPIENTDREETSRIIFSHINHALWS